MFKYTDKQQLLILYIQHDSTIHHKTFITSCTETVRLARIRNTSYMYLCGVLHIEGMLDNLNHN